MQKYENCKAIIFLIIQHIFFFKCYDLDLKTSRSLLVIKQSSHPGVIFITNVHSFSQLSCYKTMQEEVKVKHPKRRHCSEIARRCPQKCLIWQICRSCSSVGGQHKASLPACFSAGVFAYSHIALGIPQLWRPIEHRSQQWPQFPPRTQMFTFEPATLLAF